MTAPARNVTDLSAAKLERLDTKVAELESRLDAARRERSELAASWGYANGYRVRVTPDQMRRAMGAGNG